jgi:hypothetical protein
MDKEVGGDLRGVYIWVGFFDLSLWVNWLFLFVDG